VNVLNSAACELREPNLSEGDRHRLADDLEAAALTFAACVAALQGVVAVADRKTDEFDAARAALKRAGAQ
jgi:hypothetical protein